MKGVQELLEQLIDLGLTIKIEPRHFTNDKKITTKVDVTLSYYGQYHCGGQESSLEKALTAAASTVRNVSLEQANKLLRISQALEMEGK